MSDRHDRNRGKWQAVMTNGGHCHRVGLGIGRVAPDMEPFGAALSGKREICLVFDSVWRTGIGVGGFGLSRFFNLFFRLAVVDRHYHSPRSVFYGAGPLICRG